MLNAQQLLKKKKKKVALTLDIDLLSYSVMCVSVILTACLLCTAALSSTCEAESETEQLPTAEADSPPGHMQPLGSHTEPKPVTRISHMPTPQEFHKFVALKQPVIFEGLMSNQQVIKNWQSDGYLRTQFGDEVMGIEQRKKENRSLYDFEMTMAQFLDVYKDDNIYMVSDLSSGLYDEWVVPRFLLCGGYTDHIKMVFIWFSSGGTKSVLHTDTLENLHCLVSGTKKFVMFKPHFASFIGPENAKQGYYNIDVERVNMTAYPNLSKIPWYLVDLTPGDCLYLPYLWIHHVESRGRNMGINVWWNPFNYNSSDCPADANELPEFAPLSEFEPETATNLKQQIEEAKRENGVVYAMDMLSNEFVRAGVQLEDIEQLFDVIQPGSEGVLIDPDKISKAALRKGALFLIDLFTDYQADSEDNLKPPEESSRGSGGASGSEQEEKHSQQNRDEL